MTERHPDEVPPPAEAPIGRRALLKGGLGVLAAGVVASVRPADAAASPGFKLDGSLIVLGDAASFGLAVSHGFDGAHAVFFDPRTSNTDTVLDRFGTSQAGVVAFGSRTGGIFTAGTDPLSFRADTTTALSGIQAFAPPGGTAMLAVAPDGYALQADGCLAYSTAGIVTIPRGRKIGTDSNPQVQGDNVVLATCQTPGSPQVVSAEASKGRVRVTLGGSATKPTNVGYLAFYPLPPPPRLIDCGPR
jgi:hypothetical protein